MTGAVGNYETQSSSRPVEWLGLTAVYVRDERQLMAALPVQEQVLLHALKSLTSGEITSEVRDSDSQVVNSKPQEAPRGDESTQSRVYVDPEEIEFGAKRVKKLYAVCWSWRKHRICKTKDGGKDRRSASRTIKTWLRWHERQGWEVIAGSQGAGWYIMQKGDRKSAISLHEYDAVTKERL